MYSKLPKDASRAYFILFVIFLNFFKVTEMKQALEEEVSEKTPSMCDVDLFRLRGQ